MQRRSGRSRAAVDITDVYIAINTGNWSTGTTWDIGIAPGIADEAYITPGVTVAANASTNTAKSLTILAGGTLNIATGNTGTIDSALQNSGTLNVTGGTLTVNGRTIVSGIANNGGGLISVSPGSLNLGAAGGARPFAENGTLTVSGGTTTINGSMSTPAGSVISRSGGNIIVDGNAGGVPANSVPCGTPIVSLVNAANNFTGGIFTVVDPHACTTGTNTMVYNNAANVTASGTHAFRMGDGISTDPGGQTPFNFSVNPSHTYPVGDANFYTPVIISGASPCGNLTSSIAALAVNPLPRTITAATTTIFCAGGSVVLAAPAGFSYQWLVNNAIIPAATATSYTATASGSYSVIITNAASAGCSDTSNVIPVWPIPRHCQPYHPPAALFSAAEARRC